MILVFLVVSAYLGQLLPKMMASLAKTYEVKELFFADLKVLFFIFIGEYLNRVCYQLSINKYVQYTLLNTRKYCYENWLLSFEAQKSSKKSDEYPLGEILSRIMNDTESIRELVTSGAFGILIDLVFIVSCLVSFFTLDQFVGLHLIGLEVSVVILLVWASKYMAQAFLRVRKQTGILSRSVANVTGGLKQSYFFVNDNYGQKKINDKFDAFLKEQLKANIYDSAYYSFAESLYPIFLACIGLVFTYAPAVNAAIIIAIIDLIQRSIGPIKDITGKLSNIQRAASGFKRLDEFTYYLQSGHQSSRKRVHDNYDIQQMHVCIDEFSYGGVEDFKLIDIDFTGERGQLIGIVGMSGCGKSTLFKILSCELLAKKGKISLKGAGEHIVYDFENIESLQQYREQVSLVSQDSHVFTETVRFNISLSLEGNPEFDEFWQYVQTQIPYLKRWGKQPSDIINPKDMSLGQKQLISALRSCFLKKPIVLFDEISSALDSDLELALRKLVLLVQQHSLTIIVAHRLETITAADQIIVMENGKIIARGKHQHLLDSSALYQEFLSHLS
jgi:ABC-type multidrug transport system fused ATPase/permease subunit